MDYVYIVKDGPNEELRYSIRSVVKNMPPGNIWVVGGKPDWYSGNYIKVLQNKAKYSNAIANLIAACESDQISNDFVLMNDDFFVIKKVESILTYHGMLLPDKIKLYDRLSPTSTYTKRIRKTSHKLTRLGVSEQLDYDLHVPMIMNKSKLAKILKRHPDCFWRSMYGNLHSPESIEMQDVKVYTSTRMQERSFDYKTSTYPYISSEDDSFRLLYDEFLKESFPDKSFYENDVL